MPSQRSNIQQRHDAKGFTLIELVAVIVILGILAAVALPKFTSMATEARIAKLKALDGAVKTLASQLASMCYVQSDTCDPKNNFLAVVPTSGRAPYVTAWSTKFSMNFGWPVVWDGYGASAGYDPMMGGLQLSGITVASYVGMSMRRDFLVDDAPDPANCSVTYRAATSASSPASTTMNTSGC